MASLDPSNVVPAGVGGADATLSLLSSGKSLIEGFQIFKFNPFAIMVLIILVVSVFGLVTLVDNQTTTVFVNMLTAMMMPELPFPENGLPYPEDYPGYPESVADEKFPVPDVKYRSNRPRRVKNSSSRPKRSKESAKKVVDNTPASNSTVTPVVSVLKAALMGNECFQRIMCHLGNFTTSVMPFNKEVTTVLKIARSFAPIHVSKSIDAFAGGEQCDKFACGELPVRK